MKERRTNLVKRITSGAMAGLLVVTSVINSLGSITAYAAERKWEDDPKQQVSYRYEKQSDVEIAVEAASTSFMPGEEIALNLYVRNNSGQTLTNGVLEWEQNELLTDAYFTASKGLIEEYMVSEKAAKDETIDDEIIDEKMNEPAETQASESETEIGEQEVPLSSSVSRATPSDAETPDGSDDDEPEILQKVTDVTLESGEICQVTFFATVADVEKIVSCTAKFHFTAETEDGAEKTADAAYTFMAGGIAMDSIAFEDDNKFETVSTNTLYLTTLLDVMETAPEAEDGEMTSPAGSDQTETVAGEAGQTEAGQAEAAPGEADQTEAGQTEAASGKADQEEAAPSETDQTEADQTDAATDENTAKESTPANADKAEEEGSTEAETLPGTEVIEDGDVAKAAMVGDEPSEVSADTTTYQETSASADETDETEKPEPATPSNSAGGTSAPTTEGAPAAGETYAKEEAPAEVDEEARILKQAESVKYTVTTYGAELMDGAVATYLADQSGADMIMSVLDLQVKAGTEPGLYFGTVQTSVKVDGKTLKATQSFHFYVIGEENTLTLKSRTADGGYIKVSGPINAFPADVDMLSLVVSDVPEETKTEMQEVMEAKAEALGISVSSMRAVDIKIMADGEISNLSDDVTVTFESLRMESVAEPEEETGSSVATIAANGAQMLASVGNLFGEDPGIVEESYGGTGLTVGDDTGEAADDAAEDGEEQTITSTTILRWDSESEDIEELETELDDEGNITFRTMNADSPYMLLNGTRGIAIEDAIGYIHSATIFEVKDGQGFFDGDDEPGNDSRADNGRVRTFDTITYSLNYGFTSLREGEDYKEGRIYIEAELPMDRSKAQFDLDSMSWLGDDDYTLTYYDKDNKVVEMPSLNNTEAGAAGSDKGTASYATPVARQVLSGWYDMGDGKSTVIGGTQTLSFGIKVLAAANGDEIKPIFRAWLQGNEENKDKSQNPYLTDEQGKGVKLEPDPIKVSAKARYNIALSRNAYFDQRMWVNPATGKSSTLRPGGGNLGDPGLEEGYIYGRMIGYTISIQLYNEVTDNNPSKLASKGLMGIELPQGDITFDLDIEERNEDYRISKPALYNSETGGLPVEEGKEMPENYTPLLWNYLEANTYDNDDWQWTDRVSSWSGVGSSVSGVNAPYARKKSDADFKTPNEKEAYNRKANYDSGTFAVNPEDKDTSSNLAGIRSNTYRFTISGFDFDLDDFVYAEQNAGGGLSIARGYDSYIGCFSAGYIQAFMQMPEIPINAHTIAYTVKVSNFKAHGLKGEEAGEVSQIYYTDTATQPAENDNTVRTTLYIKTPGYLTTYNSFTTVGSGTDKGIFGRDYWTQGYDASVFSGSDIKMWGGVYLWPSNYYMNRVNILQKFDSVAMTPIPEDPSSDVVGARNSAANSDGVSIYATGSGQLEDSDRDLTMSVKVLYGVDPLNKDGWDSNDPTDMERMNKVVEEDLLYYSTKTDAEKVGKIVAVLYEIRYVHVNTGSAIYAGIPMHIEVDQTTLEKGQTYCTVNAIRVWPGGYDDDTKIDPTYDDQWDAMDSFTWEGKNEKMDPSTGKRSDVEKETDPGNYTSAGYTHVTKYADGYVAPYWKNASYQPKGGSWYYTKYSFDGGKASGGVGEVNYGASIMLLGYKAAVGLDIVQIGENGNPKMTYDMDKGQMMVDYRISNINTTVESPNNQDIPVIREELPTTLYVELDMDSRLEVLPPFTCEGQTLAPGSGWITVPYSYTTESGEKNSTYELRCIEKDGKLTFEFKDVIVGAKLKDILFSAQIYYDTPNNAHLLAAVNIWGTSDHRGYTTTNENRSEEEITVNRQMATGLHKSVNKKKVDIGEDFTYTVVYENIAKTALPEVYFYDVFPYSKDGRGSDFHGTYKVTSISVNLGKAAESGDTEKKGEIRYSTDSGAIDGTMSDWLKFEQAFGGVLADNIALNSEHSVSKEFPEENGTDISEIKGIGIKISSLQPGEKIELVYTIDPDDNNEPLDMYFTNAHAWYKNQVPDDEVDQTSAILGNLVQTTVVSRSIEGVVWQDTDWDGVRENGEPYISGVTVTLLKKDKDGKFVVWDNDVTGKPFSERTEEGQNILTTNANGEYRFTRLAEGEYLIVFGSTDKKYLKETLYQIGGADSENANDGVNISEAPDDVESASYGYMIKDTPEQAFLKYVSAELMTGVTDYREHRDLGLVIGARLRLTKDVQNPENLPNEELTWKKFLIKLICEETGEEISTVALADGDQSGVFEILDFSGPEGSSFKTGERTFRIEEIVPMEYVMTGMEAGDVELKDGEWVTKQPMTPMMPKEGKYTVTIKPGDFKEVKVTNVPHHEGYFHNTAEVTNSTNTEGSGYGNFYKLPSSTSPEVHQEVPNTDAADNGRAPVSPDNGQSVAMNAVVPEREKEHDIEDERLV